jgi:hypothetical protein
MHDDWRDICAVLYGAESPLIWRSLKIPIYGIATGKIDSRLRYVAKYFLRQLTKFTWKRVSEARYDFVFLLPYNTPSNKNNLLPVIQYCVSNSLRTLLILGEDFGDAPSGSGWPECDICRIEDFQGWPGIREKLSIACSVPGIFLGIYRGFNRLPTIRRGLLRNAIGLYYHVFSALVFRSLFDMLFEKISARYVVTTSDLWPFENQFVWAAKEAGLKTYVIQHGIIVEYWWPFDADYLFLWGDLHREQLVGLGAPEDRILIGGMPALEEKLKTRTDYDFQPGCPLNVLIISQTHTPDFSVSFMENFASCLKLLGERGDRFRVVVKLHPIENMSFYGKHNLDRYPNFTFVKNEKGIHDCIIDSDLCISLFSTGGLEAVALNRPSIVLNLESWIEDYAWWPRYGGGLYIPDVPSLRAVLENILEDPGRIQDILEKQKSFLHRSFSNMGTACQEIVRAVKRCSTGIPSTTGISVWK